MVAEETAEEVVDEVTKERKLIMTITKELVEGTRLENKRRSSSPRTALEKYRLQHLTP